jgi:hypothetical protein
MSWYSRGLSSCVGMVAVVAMMSLSL